MIPDRLWLDRRLEPIDIRLWCAIVFTARGRSYSDATDAGLASTIAAGERTIRRSLDRLEDAGYIRRMRDGRRLIELRPDGDETAAESLSLRVVG